MHSILVVDDDPHIRDVICFALRKAGHLSLTARDGTEALALFETRMPDLVILDVGLPDKDGLEVCRQIRRRSEIPIVFLSARDEEIDRVLGLEMGGDDYVTKPFSPRELVARVAAILKRAKSATFPEAAEPAPLVQGTLSLDPIHRSVTVEGTLVALTAIEFDILTAFLSRPRMTFTREQVMTAAYPANVHVSDRTIDSHIRNVRSKLTRQGCRDAIETVHGVGFRLGPCRLERE